jgi:hypothetical protein
MSGGYNPAEILAILQKGTLRNGASRSIGIGAILSA